MHELHQRASSRVRAFLQGRAVFNNGFASLDCTVRDISETGARLEIANSVTLPDHFDLMLPKKGVTHRVRIVWRRDEEVGVSFESAVEPAPSQHSDLERRLARIETELSKLGRAIAEMRQERK